MHVVKTPSVGGRLRDLYIELGLAAIRRRQFSGGEETAEKLFVIHPRLEAIRQRVAGVEQGGGASAAGVFPLGFGGEAIGLAFLFGEPFAEGHGLIPAHAAQGLVVLGAAFAEAGLEGTVLAQSHLCSPHHEGLGDGDLVRGLFVPVRIIELRRVLVGLVIGSRTILPHDKTSGVDTHEFHADGVGCLSRTCVSQATCHQGQRQKPCFHQRGSQALRLSCR